MTDLCHAINRKPLLVRMMGFTLNIQWDRVGFTLDLPPRRKWVI